MKINLKNHYTGADAIEITTERAESSYGQPVAVLIGGPFSGSAYGPADVVPSADDALPWLSEPARIMVAAAAAKAGMDDCYDDPLYCRFVGI
jgi:hypothetical protein